MNITKYKASEIAEDRELIKGVKCYVIRKCTCCGAYVNVDDYATEYNDTEYDACMDCIEHLEKGETCTVFDEEYYEDILAEWEEENEEED